MNKNSLNEIIKLLEEQNYSDVANELKELAKKYYSLTNKNEKELVGKKIKEMCHPKWLGDIYIPKLPKNYWMNLLANLSKSL